MKQTYRINYETPSITNCVSVGVTRKESIIKTLERTGYKLIRTGSARGYVSKKFFVVARYAGRYGVGFAILTNRDRGTFIIEYYV